MRLVGWMFALGAAGAGSALLAGCFEESPQQRARAVCDAYCECVVTVGQVEQCIVEQCLPALPPVSNECLDCVVQNAQTCSTLDALCTDLCIDNSQP